MLLLVNFPINGTQLIAPPIKEKSAFGSEILTTLENKKGTLQPDTESLTNNFTS